jgi:hypothetical protein
MTRYGDTLNVEFQDGQVYAAKSPEALARGVLTSIGDMRSYLNLSEPYPSSYPPGAKCQTVEMGFFTYVPPADPYWPYFVDRGHAYLGGRSDGTHFISVWWSITGGYYAFVDSGTGVSKQKLDFYRESLWFRGSGEFVDDKAFEKGGCHPNVVKAMLLGKRALLWNPYRDILAEVTDQGTRYRFLHEALVFPKPLLAEQTEFVDTSMADDGKYVYFGGYDERRSKELIVLRFLPDFDKHRFQAVVFARVSPRPGVMCAEVFDGRLVVALTSGELLLIDLGENPERKGASSDGKP